MYELPSVSGTKVCCVEDTIHSQHPGLSTAWCTQPNKLLLLSTLTASSPISRERRKLIFVAPPFSLMGNYIRADNVTIHYVLNCAKSNAMIPSLGE